MRAARIVIIASHLCVAGCVGPLVPVSQVDESTALELGQSVSVFEARETPANASVLGPITATSCKNKAWDKEATAEDATNQLRLLSRQRGGDAVGNLTCEAPRGTDLATNCWASVTCTGTSIKLAGPPLVKRPNPRR